MRFTKMHGLGNDYLFVNLLAEKVDDDPSALAKAVSDRHRGVGADGLILIGPSRNADLRMRIYNSDGSLGKMCGNGLRCLVKYAYERGLCRKPEMDIETDAGTKHAECMFEAGRVVQVRVNMGPARFDPASLPARFHGETLVDYPLPLGTRALRVNCVSVGNPHAVVFVNSFEEIDLCRDGPAIERHKMFPERINAQFARIDSTHEITLRSWERGAGPTQACGTGACAVSAIACHLGKTTMPVTVHLPGGDLRMESDPSTGDLFMTGPAEEVFEGEWTPQGVCSAI